MEWVVLFFLAASVYLYCLFGGADFGAGVLEIFAPRSSRKQYEELTKKAIGPVWEANHIWLIIAVVILFNGFPKVYAALSVYFHIPLTLMLAGIVIRGCAFSFRHYDAVEDQFRVYYSTAFSFSSLITPVMFGVIIGAMMAGKVDPGAVSYQTVYVTPWFNLFSFSVGFFILCIFSFLASVFFIGETKEKELIDYFRRTAQIANMATILAGGAVFISGALEGINFTVLFLTHPVSLSCVAAATVSLIPTWICLNRAWVWRARLAAGFQLLMILAAWAAILFPNIMIFKDGQGLSLLDAAAPAATLFILGWALIIGSILFFPALYYLFAVFKTSK